MQYVHLSYLEQLSQLLENKHKSQAARLGHIAKQIREKHVVHINGADPPKLKRCKACQGPITCNNIVSKKKEQHDKKILIKCSLCGHLRRYSKAVEEVKPNSTTKRVEEPLE